MSLRTSTLYVTSSVLLLSSPGLRAAMALLEWLECPEPKTVVGIKELAMLTRGRFNPASDWALQMSNGAVVRNPIELSNWIQQQGLVPL